MKNIRNPIGIILVLLALLCNFGIAQAFAGTPTPNASPIVARVIYSEASPICTAQERQLVASVIYNRIGHPGFGNCKTAEAVVKAKGQFNCIGDKGNGNWLKTASPNLSDTAWKQSLSLASGFRPITSAVYYHDKSIAKPRAWDNKYWRTVKVAETSHFIFYAVEAKPKLIRGKSLAKL